MIVRNRKKPRPSVSSKPRPPGSAIDPTRTVTLRLAAVRTVRKKFARLKGLIVKLVVGEDAFGLAEREPYKVENCNPGQLRGARGECGPGIGKSVPRDQMPQIRKEHFEEFLAWLDNRGVRVYRDKVPAENLAPTQKEFRQERVDAIPDEMLDQPILVSEDLYVLDGTHRWVKHWQRDKKGLVPVLVLGKELHDILPLMQQFPKSQFVENSFCPTGQGGGVDPTCHSGQRKELTSEEATQIISKLRSGDSRSKNRGSESHESPFGPAILTSVPLNNLPPEVIQLLRESTNPERVARYARENVKDPVVLFKRRKVDGFGVSDGGHRILAAIARGDTHVRAIIPAKDEQSLTINRFQFHSSPDKVLEFRKWLRQQFKATLLGKSDEELWAEFARRGYEKGAGRAFDDVNRKTRWRPGEGGFYGRSKQQFLKSSFGRPESVDKLKLLAGRSFTDLANVTEDMAARMSRTIMDGLSRGVNPRELAGQLAEDLDVSEARAETIARTEIIRAHAEGQLDAFEKLGVEEVGVAVEWDTAKDGRVCPHCRPLQGVVLTVQEAHGLIPNHPNCVLGDTRVYSPSPLSIMRAVYSGKIFEIITAKGRRLTITENHVLLTQRGWVRAKELSDRDYLIDASVLDRVVLKSPNNYLNVPSIANYFAAATKPRSEGRKTSTNTRPEYLHGDGKFVQGKIDIVAVDSFLRTELQSSIFGVRVESPLMPRDIPSLHTKSLNRLSDISSVLIALGASTDCLMGFSSVSGMLFRGSFAHHKSVSSSLVPSINPLSAQESDCKVVRQAKLPIDTNSTFTSLVEFDNLVESLWTDEMFSRLRVRLGSTPDDSELTELLPECFSIALKILCYGPDAQSSSIKLNRDIYDRIDSTFTRHVTNLLVYDLETQESLYIANGIISSNCRCAFVPANVGEDQAKQKRTKAEILEAFEEADVDPPELEEQRPEPLIDPTKNELYEFSRCLRSVTSA